MVGLNEAQIQALLARCERRRRVLQGLAWFEHWARLCGRGLTLVLLPLVCARALGMSLAWLSPVLVVWCVASLAWALPRLAGCARPAWQLPAYVDRASGAQGALLQHHAGQRACDPVPLVAASLRLPVRWPVRTLLSAAALAFAYGLCLMVPLPTAAKSHTAATGGTSLAIERTAQLLQRLPARDPEVHAFQAAAQATLRNLSAQTAGLSRSDFDTLERIEAHSRSLMSHEASAQSANAAAEGSRAALSAFAKLLSEYAAAEGAAVQAAALQAGLTELRTQLEQAGLDAAALEQLARAAEAGAKQKPGDKPGQAVFDREAVKALRKQIGQLEASPEPGTGDKTAAGDGSSPSHDAPTQTPLQKNHVTQDRPGTRFTPTTFAAQAEQETVSLGTGLGQHTEKPVRGPATSASTQQFDTGSDTEFWHLHRSPQLRSVLERYFDGNAKP
ncbi:MAG: hypothetical protein RL701_3900 [Pseudomonadota bacterium]